ncbi:HNH endonuclease domain protein [Gleimia coleocanis DSM 15436]|uniref:HNH endonuclease domain protein n=1 Tax=Gleimia coleocanis DSM 15436 TaxID=525245 RepID=C0W0W4_9ACTO|nr:type II CRISPR RNA-guided endonuclease Cas9 [Gleimia coleocanis]EEH63688.1 HNH endonuclease domain protein [Gleimia coleocanis DSM 15436]
MDNKNYRIGIDVGLNSIGFCAVEVDQHDTPLGFLNLSVYRHDAGIDPNGKKTNTTRLAMSGVARRTRRLFRKRKRRLAALDRFIEAQGWTLPDHADYKDPYTPWLVRAELAQTPIRDENDLHEKLAIAVRHIARHRGWRSPWVPVRSLHVEQPPSDQYLALKERVEAKTLLQMPEGATPAEMVVALDLSVDVNLRPKNREKTDTRPENKKPGFLGGKLMQSDNANELRKIAKIQGLDDALLRELIELVFAADSPKGASGELVGYDVLPGQHGKRRAEKAHPAFQRYRIASIVSNLRIRHLGSGADERLDVETQKRVFEYLLNAKPTADITWSDVAEEIGVERNLLMGTATQTADGERASAKPPVDVTNVAFATCKIKPLKEWWLNADYEARCVMVSALSHAEKLTEGTAAEVEVAEFLQNLSDEDNEKLDSFSLPIGRAAYSVDSLERLTKRMIENGEDLFEARVNEFGVSEDWRPPAEPIGARVGNPAVDRVLKAVNRYLMAAEAEWGAPLSVNIEHVREGFISKRQAVEIDRENQKRYQRNQAVRSQIADHINATSGVRGSDVTRYLAIQRQNGECLYCGTAITFVNSEMDHIVPRAGLGSTNTRDNLVATCERCNKSKSNKPFAVWAAECGIPGVSVAEALKRVDFWIADGFASSKEHRELQKGVKDRLKRKVSDPEIDNRSMESVAWMARELAHRVQYYFDEKHTGTKVRVFRGSLTSAARKASGFESRVNFIGGNGKTRLDRRHHAMDAATVAMLRNSVAKTLVLRGNIRASERAIGAAETWKSFRGENVADRQIFESWSENMRVLVEKFNLALYNDEVSIFSSLRLQLGNGKAHDDTITKLQMHKVGDAWSLTEIDRASTPALWCALTRQPDFTWKDGLPANEDRTIIVNGTHYGPLDKVGIFGKAAASLLVRGGSVDIGSAIHHARIYRIAGKKPTYGMVRVFAPDLLRYRNEDLFNVELPPQSVSMRYAEPKVREAIREGKAEYLGWLVVGDELLLDLSSETSGQIAELQQDFPGTTHWTVAGFFSPSRLRLRPVYLAQEGLGEDVSEGSKSIIAGQGWRPAVNKVFGSAMPEVIRRDGLGRKRRFSYSGLPVSWQG